MANVKLQNVRELIAEKRYLEAQALLRPLNTPTAQKWLRKLSQVQLEISPARSSHSSIMRRSITAFMVGIIVLAMLLVGVYEAVLRPSAPAFAESQSAVLVQPVAKQKWEYLNFTYIQMDLDFDGNQEELGTTGDTVYDTKIFDVADCGNNSTIGETADCAEKDFRGSIYYLNGLGIDGWELLNVVDKSTQYTYRVEMIFKRPAESIGDPQIPGLSGLSDLTE